MNQGNRRKLLIGAAAASVAGAAGGLLWWQRSHRDPAGHPHHPIHRDPAFPNALRLPGADGMYGVLDVAGKITITAKAVRHALLPGRPAPMLAFEVEHEGSRFLNPVLRVARGSTVRAEFWNALDVTSIIHWHGLKVDANNDGHPHYAVPAGATYSYQYAVPNRAATYWYHPHTHGSTAMQIHQGLAGVLIVEDDDELKLRNALDFVPGVTDIPLVLQDTRLDERGAPRYEPTDVEWMHGYLGNDVLVNLTSCPYLDVTARIYRFRLLNASMARVYRLAFAADNYLLDFAVLGGDGGLLQAPRPVREAYLAPGERLDVALDLRSAGPGATVTLYSLAFDPMHGETHAGGSHAHSAAGAASEHANHGATSTPDAHAHHGGSSAAGPQARTGAVCGHAASPLVDGAALALLKMYVLPGRGYDRSLPAVLSAPQEANTDGAATRRIAIDHHRMAWRINGRLFDMTSIAVTVRRGAREIWEIFNPADGMPHPMHIHGFHFRVLERAGSPEQVRQVALDERGLCASDLGWKDTVLIWPGETVRIALDFSHPFLGDQVYMFHCHNLQHADRGMMVNVKVAA